jgi:hypothetical protein
MTPANDIGSPNTVTRPARSPVRRKRAASQSCTAASRSSRTKKTRRQSYPQGVWARLRRKLEESAEWALCDARVGAFVFFAIYVGSTWVMLGLIGFDKITGTSLLNLTLDWFIKAKFTALGAGLVWSVLILAPAALLARCLRTSFDKRPVRVPTKSRVRPIFNALAVYVATLVGIAVWNMPPPPGPPEFVVPGPDVYGARLAILNLQLMALHCMQDPSPPHCRRPDIQRIQARYYLKWLDEGPGVFEGTSRILIAGRKTSILSKLGKTNGQVNASPRSASGPPSLARG